MDNYKLVSIVGPVSTTGTVSISGTVPVTGPLTDAQLRATPVPISLSSTTITGSVAVTNANLDVALSTRLKPADTLAGVTTVGAVTSITNALPVGSNLLGKIGIDQTTPGTTNKVSIGTDGTVAATQSGIWTTGRTWTLTSGTDSVAVSNAFLLDSTFTGRINTQGQKTMAASTPVVIASDQSGLPINVSAYGGTATTLGQKTMAASLPVVISSDQGAIPITGSISATSAATASNYNPQYTEQQSSALAQTIKGELRTNSDRDIILLETMQAILMELRVQNIILHQTLNSRDDLDLLRNDAMQTLSLIN